MCIALAKALVSYNVANGQVLHSEVFAAVAVKRLCAHARMVVAARGLCPSRWCRTHMDCLLHGWGVWQTMRAVPHRGCKATLLHAPSRAAQWGALWEAPAVGRNRLRRPRRQSGGRLRTLAMWLGRAATCPARSVILWCGAAVLLHVASQ